MVSSFFAMLADCNHAPSYGQHSFVTLPNEQMELALIVGANIGLHGRYFCSDGSYITS
jgi:hypothetical protein